MPFHKENTFRCLFMKTASVLLVLSLLTIGCSENGATDTDSTEENEEVTAPPSTIDLSEDEQVILGFGAANIVNWRADMTSNEIDKAFNTENGNLGFSILRIRIPPQESEWQDYLPTAKAAYDKGVKVVASPWTPPADLKTNNDLVGGTLADTAYDDYARHLNDFIDYMSDNGVELYAVSVQNEPDIDVEYESCDWTPQQMKRFVLEYGDIIKTRLMAPESFQFRRQMSDPILNDPDAAENLDIVGGHIYGGGLESYPLAEEKNKDVWMTEHYTTSDRSANLWPDALQVGDEMQRVMNANMNAYVWWYIVRYYGPIGDGEENTTKGAITKRGHVMSHFSRFIRPGFQRKEATFNPQSGVLVTAYEGNDKLIVVALNTGSYSSKQQFVIANSSRQISSMTPFVTSSSSNVRQEEAVAVSSENADFIYDIPPQSIITFVEG